MGSRRFGGSEAQGVGELLGPATEGGCYVLMGRWLMRIIGRSLYVQKDNILSLMASLSCVGVMRVSEETRT